MKILETQRSKKTLLNDNSKRRNHLTLILSQKFHIQLLFILNKSDTCNINGLQAFLTTQKMAYFQTFKKIYFFEQIKKKDKSTLKYNPVASHQP